jgi:phenylacetate-CoA ligase
VPTVDKHVLSERNLDFLCVPRERVVEIVTTSGSTGEPLLWMLTEADVRRLAENERLSFECAGLTARDTVLVAVSMDRCFIAGMAYWLGLRELGCAAVRTGAASPMLALEMIERAQPTAIVAVPSFLRVIAEKAHETGFDLRGCGVKKAVCIGEPIRDRAFELNASGRAIGRPRAALFDLRGDGTGQFALRSPPARADIYTQTSCSSKCSTTSYGRCRKARWAKWLPLRSASRRPLIRH